MNPNFSNKGTISVSGTVIVECDSRTRKLIRCMKFRNPAGYTLTIDVYDKYSNTTVTTTSMTLSAGDQLIDDDELYLEPGDKITVTSDITGTTFIVTGEDIDLKKR
jgi:hypothetical protein